MIYGTKNYIFLGWDERYQQGRPEGFKETKKDDLLILSDGQEELKYKVTLFYSRDTKKFVELRRIKTYKQKHEIKE